MATLWNPTSTDYTAQMLQGGAGPGSSGQWTADQIQQLQQAGVTLGDLQSLSLLGPPTTSTPTQNWTSGGQSGVGRSSTIGGQVVDPGSVLQQQQNATLLKLIMAGGAGKGGGTPPPPNAYGTQYPLYAIDAQGNPTGKPVYANPSNQASLLGAAALQMPAVINPPPSGTPSAKSGVAPTGGALIGTSVPQVGWGSTGGQGGANWNQLAQAAGFSPRDIAQFQQSGMTPDAVARQFNIQAPLAGPWTNPQTGSVFTPVARTAPTMALGATPLQAAVQPTAIGYNPTATPFAQAPPAPGIQIPQSPLIAAHTSALANAGQALFAHFGGDPASASPADIADFHRQLADHIAGLAAAPQPTAAKKMQRGGVVPGRGNKDTVPALLTPGEYVIPKDQVAQFFGGRTPAKMAAGGFADPDPDPNAPPEARRKTLSTAAQSAPAAPTAPTVPAGSHLTTGLASAAQTYASSMGTLPRNPIGSGSGVDIRNTRLDPDPDLPSLKAAGMLGGGGLSSPGAQSALGGVASGLNQAAQAIASSVKPWQMQPNQIPAPPPAPAAPQFTQPPAPQQAQQGTNPYAAYIANQARYPTSPYYT